MTLHSYFFSNSALWIENTTFWLVIWVHKLCGFREHDRLSICILQFLTSILQKWLLSRGRIQKLWNNIDILTLELEKASSNTNKMEVHLKNLGYQPLVSRKRTWMKSQVYQDFPKSLRPYPRPVLGCRKKLSSRNDENIEILEFFVLFFIISLPK